MALKRHKEAADPDKAADRAPPSPEALQDEIRIAARRIFEDRQARQLEGDEVSDWLKAEAQVKAKRKL